MYRTKHIYPTKIKTPSFSTIPRLKRIIKVPKKALLNGMGNMSKRAKEKMVIPLIISIVRQFISGHLGFEKRSNFTK